jgi:hypothetical protein
MRHPSLLQMRICMHADQEGCAMRTLSAFCIAATLTAQAHAACSVASPAHTLALTELYTSDGCDSCPPANRWLSALAARGFGSDKVVPLGLHVDYWDYIGWKDIYAQPQFTERQRMLSRLSGSTFVYTPQVVVQGRDFRGWGSAAFDAHVKAVNARPARADLRLGLEAAPGKVLITASALVKAPGAKAQLFVALTQSRISSDVKAGENRGVTLKHDHVVRDWIGPVALDAAGSAHLERTLVPPKGAPTNDLGAVAFVQDAVTGEVWQALKLDACGA